MSIIADFDFDDNAYQYKRFAILTCSYVEKPETAKEDIAKIPLENFFRLLEMYRYDSFSESMHCGVLDLDNPVTFETEFLSEASWEKMVVTALDTASNEAYQSKDQAIDEMENVLRQLVRKHTLDDQVAKPAKKFLDNFIKAIA